ncbi:hypothetical protein RRG08_000808 [Elysia crispata]|uniref:Uncharacterized protein n=1 Tax=Elysia crispata TaxID=231223 RepID=A0AAE0XXA2_9GAST|nr:hypothetical protein RRG08_000808 [Elysia crispata]
MKTFSISITYPTQSRLQDVDLLHQCNLPHPVQTSGCRPSPSVQSTPPSPDFRIFQDVDHFHQSHLTHPVQTSGCRPSPSVPPTPPSPDFRMKTFSISITYPTHSRLQDVDLLHQYHLPHPVHIQDVDLLHQYHLTHPLQTLGCRPSLSVPSNTPNPEFRV